MAASRIAAKQPLSGKIQEKNPPDVSGQSKRAGNPYVIPTEK